MGERGSRKIPVTEREFLWVQDDDKGEVVLHVGPTMVSPTAADRVVVDDGKGGFREDHGNRPQRMVELADSQYAVLSNPLGEPDEGPNGRFRPGRNEARSLRNGTRHMIPGPCSFYLRPGQRVEVRDAHELASNQYLVVKVYGAVDTNAPYYEITARSAAITTATAEDTSGSASAGLEGLQPVELSRGQLIVIRGLDTQFYIPPTGVDVVPDLSVDAAGNKLTAAAARKLLRTLPSAPPPFDGYGEGAVGQNLAEVGLAPEEVAQAAMEVQAFDDEPYQQVSKQPPRRKLAGVEQAARMRQAVQRPAPAAAKAEEEEAAESLSDDEMRSLLSSDVHRQALEREVRKARLVRQAVVLGEKEFCVILDADGKRQIKVGPARVFPGPYDSFMTRGSHNRIYYAYELLPQRALWLRFIAPIGKERLAARLPRSVELEQDSYSAGDELILTGVNSFFFPFNEIEILHPLTGQPHVGNDHSDVFIEAIGIDQKSGIYVRDLTTGEARLVRGKRSYLVDPRREVHITRTVPTEQWNLWIGANEAHKRSTRPVTTPWAISITVPHNSAVLVTSADGHRVIEGPCVELLEYEETLVPMTLSMGTPKSDERTLRTCYLRTVGNQVSDVIRIETADFVEIDVRVSYRVTFDSSLRDHWFAHDNYVAVLCDHLRSLVRGSCRQIVLTELWANIPTQIRDIILGPKTDEGRTGRLFEVNGMRVTEVEVLSSEVLDAEIAELLESVQRDSVSRQIGDRQAAEQLASEKLQHAIERDRLQLRSETRERQGEFDALVSVLDLEGRLATVRGEEDVQRLLTEFVLARSKAELEAQVLRERLAAQAQAERLGLQTEARVEADRKLHAEQQANAAALAQLELERIAAQSAATVAERQAVQPALVEALTALGDKVVLGEVARNMNLVSLFKGKDVATLFGELLGGSKLGRTIREMLPAEDEGAADAD